MNTKMIVGLAALVLLAPAGMASYQYHREVVGPTTVTSNVAGEFGIAFCDNNGTIGQQFNSVNCRHGGVGAIIDVSDITNTTNYVLGTCSVEQTSAQDPPGYGPFAFTCSTDRDNDGFSTNVDASRKAVGDKNDGPQGNDTWDDDFASANVSAPNSNPPNPPTGGAGTVEICFRADVDSGPTPDGVISPDYPDDGEAVWDTFVVFIAINANTTQVTAGTFAVDIDVEPVGDGDCTPSSHEHNDWTNGG
jgi:hypothetical protein